jgi:hypothetical protein
MKKTIIFIIVGLLFLSLYICSDGKYDFRKTRWGMTKQEVINSERGLRDYNNQLTKEDIINGLSVFVFYEFDNNILVGGHYIFNVEHTISNLYISDYNNINSALDSKYGAQFKYEETWNSDLFKNKPNKRGLALSIGAVSYYTSWKTNRSYIVHQMTGDDDYILHLISYFKSGYVPKSFDNDSKL